MKIVLNMREVERRRVLRGWTKRDLAEAAGIHFNTAWRATKGRGVGVKVARKIADALGVSLRTLGAEIAESEPSAAVAGG